MKKSLALAVAAMLVAIGATAHAGVVILDSFDGPAGTNLAAHTPNVVNGGTATWNVNSDAVLNGSGSVSVAAANANSNVASQASIAMPGSVYNYNGDVAVKAVAVVNTPNSWVSLGFSSDNNPWSWWFNSSLQAQARVYASGYWQVLVPNGGASGSIAGFDPSVSHTIEFKRDYNWNVALVVDGNTLTTNWFGWTLTPGSTSPGVGYRISPGDLVGGGVGVGSNRILQFVAGTGTFDVPEPVTLSVLALGGSMVVLRSRRCA